MAVRLLKNSGNFCAETYLACKKKLHTVALSTLAEMLCTGDIEGLEYLIEASYGLQYQIYLSYATVHCLEVRNLAEITEMQNLSECHMTSPGKN